MPRVVFLQRVPHPIIFRCCQTPTDMRSTNKLATMPGQAPEPSNAHRSYNHNHRGLDREAHSRVEDPCSLEALLLDSHRILVCLPRDPSLRLELSRNFDCLWRDLSLTNPHSHIPATDQHITSQALLHTLLESWPSEYSIPCVVFLPRIPHPINFRCRQTPTDLKTQTNSKRCRAKRRSQATRIGASIITIAASTARRILVLRTRALLRRSSSTLSAFSFACRATHRSYPHSHDGYVSPNRLVFRHPHSRCSKHGFMKCQCHLASPQRLVQVCPEHNSTCNQKPSA
jgi:hypothetical protein